jgi:hypothetical protein
MAIIRIFFRSINSRSENALKVRLQKHLSAALLAIFDYSSSNLATVFKLALIRFGCGVLGTYFGAACLAISAGASC